jgi:protein involved in polysaccharide export with SLBB domain
MVCHYAAYLRARAHVTPEVSVDGNRAEVCLGVGDKVLVTVFGCRP